MVVSGIGTPRGPIGGDPPVVGEVKEEDDPLKDVTMMGLDQVEFDAKLDAFLKEQEAQIMIKHD